MISKFLLLIYLLLPVAAWMLYARVFKDACTLIPLFMAVWGLGSFIHWSGAAVLGRELKANMERYEHSGIQGHEAEEATRRYASDTGRTYAPYLAIPAALVWVSMNFLFFWIVSLLVPMFFPKRKPPPKAPIT